MLNKEGGNNQRLAIMLGMLTKDKNHPIRANIPSGNLSQFSCEKYKFLLNAPFNISNKCCDIMKKNPAKSYAKKTGRKPITAQMACESRLRTQKWLNNGCNGFDMTSPISNPMSFWTEQDVLQYIRLYDLPICTIYGEVVTEDEIKGQTNLGDYSDCGCYNCEGGKLRTTGADRTGCMFCMFGMHLEKEPNRFQRLKELHPITYDNIMKPWDEGGLGFKEVIDWINENGNMNIRY